MSKPPKYGCIKSYPVTLVQIALKYITSANLKEVLSFTLVGHPKMHTEMIPSCKNDFIEIAIVLPSLSNVVTALAYGECLG